MPLSNNPEPSERNRFKPKQTFDEYRLKHGSEHRYYKTISDPVSDKISNRRRAQIISALMLIFLAVAVTYFITLHM